MKYLKTKEKIPLIVSYFFFVFFFFCFLLFFFLSIFLFSFFLWICSLNVKLFFSFFSLSSLTTFLLLYWIFLFFSFRIQVPEIQPPQGQLRRFKAEDGIYNFIRKKIWTKYYTLYMYMYSINDRNSYCFC